MTNQLKYGILYCSLNHTFLTYLHNRRSNMHPLLISFQFKSVSINSLSEIEPFEIRLIWKDSLLPRIGEIIVLDSIYEALMGQVDMVIHYQSKEQPVEVYVSNVDENLVSFGINYWLREDLERMFVAYQIRDQNKE